MAKNISPEFKRVLSDYTGSIDDRRFKFLEENYGPRGGTVNDNTRRD